MRRPRMLDVREFSLIYAVVVARRRSPTSIYDWTGGPAVDRVIHPPSGVAKESMGGGVRPRFPIRPRRLLAGPWLSRTPDRIGGRLQDLAAGRGTTDAGSGGC
jgi:hypothetical protein